jgi:glucose-6-phosphate isomerase
MTETPQLDEIAIRRAPEVFHARKWGISWSTEIIDELKEVAIASPRRRSRLCLHPSKDEHHQETLIVLQKEAIEIPQRRKNGFDSKVALEGEALMTYLGTGGETQFTYFLQAGTAPYLHTSNSLYHYLEVLSTWFVFLEICKGPFHSGTTEFAPHLLKPKK